MTLTTIAWITVLLLIPILFLLWLSESREQRIKRLHGYGLSQAKVAEQLNITRYQVRKALA
jgi:hypothetical protein